MNRTTSRSNHLLEVAIVSTAAAIVVGSLVVYLRRPKPSKRRVTFRHPIDESVQPNMTSSLPETKAQVLGLLFAASWCPDCTDVVPAVGRCVAQIDNAFLEVFYVSSDRTEDEMKGFRPDSIQCIPFGKPEQRKALKQQFSTCAAKEMEGLGIATRKNGIPTLILIEKATGRVLTESAHDDVMKETTAEQLVTQWKSLL